MVFMKDEEVIVAPEFESYQHYLAENFSDTLMMWYVDMRRYSSSTMICKWINAIIPDMKLLIKLNRIVH